MLKIKGMARIIISPESQQQRLNHLRNEIGQILTLSPDLLLSSPTEKKWSAIEILDHMVLGHAAYAEKIESTLERLSECEPWEQLSSRRIPSFLFKGFVPKEGRIRYKMKTMSLFEPKSGSKVTDAEGVQEIARAFFQSLDHLENAARSSKALDVASIRFPSAIGPMVQFNVAEAIEFILRHNERHLLQIRQTVASLTSRSVSGAITETA